MAAKALLTGVLISIDNIKWRVIYASTSIIRIINVETEKTNVINYDINSIQSLLNDNRLKIVDDVKSLVIDPSKLSDSQLSKLNNMKSMIIDFQKKFGPSYKDLEGRCPDLKLFVIEKSENLGVNQTTIYRCIRRWLQSGMQDCALIHNIKYINYLNKELPNAVASSYRYEYQNKPGRKSETNTGKLLTQNDFEIFEKMKKEYLRNPNLSYQRLYDMMLLYYYVGDNTSYPSLKQLKNYISKNISAYNKKVRNSNARDVRNNERLLKDTPRTPHLRPGDIIEVDAWESDIEIISEYQEAQNIGKPIVYFMLDVCTKAIVSYYVGFENNSQMGLASIFLRLITPMTSTEDGNIVRPGMLPKILRCDRGAEYTSHYLQRISKDLCFEAQLVPAAMGSYKGTVEHSFSVLHNSFRDFLRKEGVIEPKYESKHMKEACLTMSQYREYIELYVKTYNMSYKLKDKLPTAMLKEGYGNSPMDIWNFKVNHGGGPRIISEAARNQTIYYLMYEGHATITREGIIFKGLVYRVENDPDLETRMITSKDNANKKDTVGHPLNSIDIRYDPMSIDKIYYMSNDRVKELTLHPRKNADLQGMTWSQYYDYLKIMKKMKEEGRINNQKLDFLRIIELDKLRSEATSGTRFIPRNEEVNKSRFRDKELDNYAHNMGTFMSNETQPIIGNDESTIITPEYTDCDKNVIVDEPEAPPVIQSKVKTERKRPATISDLMNLYKKEN